jgi:hypothetical protein
MAGRAAVAIGGGANGISTTLMSGSVSNARVVKGRAIYPNQATITVPDAPLQKVPGTVFLASTEYSSVTNSGGITFQDSSDNYKSHTPYGQLPNNLPAPSTNHPSWNTTTRQRISNTGNVILNGVFDEKTVTSNTFSVSFTDGYLNLYYKRDSKYPYNHFNATFILGGLLPFTFECWINLTALPSVTGAAYTMLDFRNAALSTTIPWFGINTSNQLTFQNQIWTINTPTAIAATNTWYHVCIQRTIDIVTNRAPTIGSLEYIDMFINGVRTYTSLSALTSTNSFNGTQTDPVFVGAAYNNTEFFKGYISNLRFTPGVSIYANTGFTPPTTALSPTRASTIMMCASPTLVDNAWNNFTITTGGTTAPVVSNTAPF